MTVEKTVSKKLPSNNNDQEFLKQFESDVIDYACTLSKIKYHGIKLSAEWCYLGIGKQLYVRLEALEKDDARDSWDPARDVFKFPVDEIPSVIEKLNKFYLKATKPDSDV